MGKMKDQSIDIEQAKELCDYDLLQCELSEKDEQIERLKDLVVEYTKKYQTAMEALRAYEIDNLEIIKKMNEKIIERMNEKMVDLKDVKPYKDPRVDWV